MLRYNKKPIIEAGDFLDEETLYEQIFLLRDAIKKQEVAFFVGAGISCNSGLPLAHELKRYILKKLRINDKEIKEIMECRDLPLERFMDVISSPSRSVFKSYMHTLLLKPEFSSALKIFALFREGEPNLNHVLIARLVREGHLRWVITTNFDLLIEKALMKEGLKRGRDFKVYCNEKHFAKMNLNNFNGAHIVKIHGSIDNMASVRATFQSVSDTTLSKIRQDFVKYLFSAIPPYRRILFLGYSASDDCDINPGIKSVVKNPKQISFIEHFDEERMLKDIESKSYFGKFIGEWIRYDTDDFILKLCLSFKGKGSFLEKEGYVSLRELQRKQPAIWKKYVDSWNKKLGATENKRNFIRYYITGGLLLHTLNLRRVIKFHNKALKISKIIGDRTGIRCRVSIGSFFVRFGFPKKAIEILRPIEGRGTSFERGECYEILSNAYGVLGNFQKAGEYCILRDIYDIWCEAYGIMRHFRRMGWLNKKSVTTNVKKILQDANTIKIYENALKEVDENYKGLDDFEDLGVSHKGKIAALYMKLGFIHHNLGDLNKAVKFYEKSLKLGEGMNGDNNAVKCYMCLGSAYGGLKHSESAIEYYRKAKEFFTGNKWLSLSRIVDKKILFICKKERDLKNDCKNGEVLKSS